VAACLFAYDSRTPPVCLRTGSAKSVGLSLSSPVDYLRLSLSRLVLPSVQAITGPTLTSAMAIATAATTTARPHLRCKRRGDVGCTPRCALAGVDKAPAASDTQDLRTA